MPKRFLRFALVLCAAWLSHATASAGELTLYSRDDFDGREVTLRDAVRDLSEIGFNDRAGSMIVRAGRWEVCTHANFRGNCRMVEPGEYPRLRGLNNEISSVREVHGRGRGRDRHRDDRRDERYDERDGNRPGAEQAPLVLFEHTDLNGRSVELRDDTLTLASLDFNDRTQSMLINHGSWEVCVHRDFGGACRVFGPGQHRRLERAFHRSISSVRQVRPQGDGRRDGDYGFNRREGGVELFSQPGFGGDRVQVRDEVVTLNQLNFNDRAGSLIVYGGDWEFCQHAEFRGQCLTYGPGRYDRLGSLHNQISSIRRVR